MGESRCLDVESDAIRNSGLLAAGDEREFYGRVHRAGEVVGSGACCVRRDDGARTEVLLRRSVDLAGHSRVGGEFAEIRELKNCERTTGVIHNDELGRLTSSNRQLDRARLKLGQAEWLAAVAYNAAVAALIRFLTRDGDNLTVRDAV